MQLAELAQAVERARGPDQSPAVVRCSPAQLKLLLKEEAASQWLSNSRGGWLLHGAQVVLEPRARISVERGFSTPTIPE